MLIRVCWWSKFTLAIWWAQKVGCEKFFEDKITGKKIDRPGLEAEIDYARDGDAIIVWRLDRLSRSLKDLIQVGCELESQGIGIKSIHESIDTTSSSGKLIFHIFGALAEFERNLIRERTHAGLKAARARGKMGGRPKKLNEEKTKLAQDLYNEKTRTIKQISELVGISKPTLYKYLDR